MRALFLGIATVLLPLTIEAAAPATASTAPPSTSGNAPPVATQTTSSTSSSQEPKEERKTFLQLRDRRATLETDIAELLRNLDKARGDLEKSRLLESNITSLQNDVDDESSQQPPDKNKLRQLQSYKKERETELNVIGTPDVIQRKIDLESADLDNRLREKDHIETEMNRLLSIEVAQQEFKKWMSIAFAILVLTVILGFFATSFRDEVVRRTIFSGQAGIQLLTLFSLVIAIILFGITGVLEGKELSALLGGLSGYILGRVTQPTSGQPAPGQQGAVNPGVAGVGGGY